MSRGKLKYISHDRLIKLPVHVVSGRASGPFCSFSVPLCSGSAGFLQDGVATMSNKDNKRIKFHSAKKYERFENFVWSRC